MVFIEKSLRFKYNIHDTFWEVDSVYNIVICVNCRYQKAILSNLAIFAIFRQNAGIIYTLYLDYFGEIIYIFQLDAAGIKSAHFYI